MPKLTKSFVDSATGPDPKSRSNQKFYWDSELSGFGLRVTANNAKTYIIQFRNESGRTRRPSLGRHGNITPSEARNLAKVRLGEVAYGRDPAEEKQQARTAPTVADLASDYLERHAIPNKAPKSVKDDQSVISKIINPRLGAMKVSDVNQRDVEKILIQLSNTPYKANRVRALLSKMFNLSISWEWRLTNPVTGTKKNPENARKVWLQADDLERLFTVLQSHPNQRSADIIRLLILTGARRSEVFKAEWSQFDLENSVWTKPAHTTKQRRMEHVPISDQAVAILKQIKKNALIDSPYVFPGNQPDKPINDIKRFWHQVRAEAKLGDTHLHDLRHTFASHLVSAGESLPFVGRLLGHTQAQTTQRYAHLADAPLRSATNSFGKTFESLGGASNDSGEL